MIQPHSRSVMLLGIFDELVVQAALEAVHQRRIRPINRLA
jgi:hypothetical protein